MQYQDEHILKDIMDRIFSKMNQHWFSSYMLINFKN